MSKLTVNVNGQKLNINTDNPKVADALAALIKACAERHFSIGDYFMHSTGTNYQLIRIKLANGTWRAYLINTETGKARNSTKVVLVQDPTGGDNGTGYVTDLPDEKDQFIDPETGDLMVRD